ncbi:MAG: DciA family protein [Weeksellaceae bacterium]|jgi:DNA integrity scanning protein DisA with diadenylate cyclase activity|nr:DciA family protein [Weeksellaceae bacterium]MDX9704117.1 DciA family protein [Weeksellaceae bacterium]
MKRKENQQSLGEAIRSLISELGMEEKIMLVQAEELFQEMMGKYIMSYVEEFYVKNKELFIKIKSPELKNELQYGKSKIMAHINQEIGKDYLIAVNFI